MKALPCRGHEAKHGDVVFTRQADSLLQLTAALHHLNASTAHTAAANGDKAGLPQSKKPRVRSRLLLHTFVRKAICC